MRYEYCFQLMQNICFDYTHGAVCFIYNLHNSNVVTVRADYPKEVIAEPLTVTITIDKGNLSGFGR